MCVFCAAVPFVATAGAVLNGKQREKIDRATAEGDKAPPARPIKKLTAAATGTLMMASIAYHTLIPLP
jgi:hypothetical protein